MWKRNWCYFSIFPTYRFNSPWWGQSGTSCSLPQRCTHTHTHIRYMFTGMVYIIMCNLQKMFFCRRYRNSVVSDRERNPLRFFRDIKGNVFRSPKNPTKHGMTSCVSQWAAVKSSTVRQHLHIHQWPLTWPLISEWPLSQLLQSIGFIF